MKTRILSLAGILMLIFQASQAQDSTRAVKPDSNASKLKTVPYQVTLIPPVGSNGINSHESVNNISLNIIAGYNGGVEGIEIGGFGNAIKEDVNGFQVAGFGNAAGGNLDGIQVAGFANAISGSSSGIQIAGFTNHVDKQSKTIQIAGFSNQVMRSQSGGQIAGFANYSADSLEGFQIAGFGNYSGNDSKTIQLSGFGNAAIGDVQGAQISGFGNHAENLEGVQVSGFINKADTVKGYQISLINVADTFESGFPVGLLNLVKNGYTAFNIGANELTQAEFALHMGMEPFYNVFTLGVSPIPGNPNWSLGYGIGSKVINKEQSKLALELSYHHINEDEIWSTAHNSLFRFRPTYEFHPKGNKFGIYAGPSLNFLVSSKWDLEGDTFDSSVAPYTILEDEGIHNNYDYWVGAQIGIQF